MSDQIERVALAIEATMFAPHELPVPAEIHAKYLETAKAAIAAARPDREGLEAENERLKQALYEIANRAGNYLDDDAVEWMPSIYNVACNAADGKPLSLEAPDEHHEKMQRELWAKWRPHRSTVEQEAGK